MLIQAASRLESSGTALGFKLEWMHLYFGLDSSLANPFCFVTRS